MKKILAFILLISHMNTSMFLPQVPETDVYDEKGNLVDDINSVFEYFAVVLGFDHTSDDEDTDNGQNFHLVKIADYNFEQASVVFQPGFSAIIINNFFEYQNTKIPKVSYEIITPPPEKPFFSLS